MKLIVPGLIWLAAIGLWPGPDAAAGQKKEKDKTGNTSASTASQLPSVVLSQFIDANLEKILGPLDLKLKTPQSELAQLRKSFTGRAGSASSPAERNQFQAALKVCDALFSAIDQHKRAALSPTAVTGWPQRAAQYRELINELMKRLRAAERKASASKADL